MKDPIQLILQQNNINNSYFAPTSRYYGLEVVIYKRDDGTEVPYLRRRFIAQPEEFQTISEHRVSENERLDNIAYKYLGDPEMFWRICDANAAISPDELTHEPGKIIRITLPEGYKL